MKDLTQGKPSKVLIRFALPMLLSVVFQQLYNIVDSVIAGQMIGDDALAAVGSSYPITMIYMAFAVGMNIGCSVVISQLFGGKKLEEMKTAISTSLITSAVVSLILTVIGVIFASPLLRLLNTPDNIFADSESYLIVYTMGLLFVFVYNISTATFTALGDSMTPLIFLIASSVGNIFADILFVAVFKMGVAGLAWATLICQAIAAFLAFFVLFGKIRGIKTEKYKLFSGKMLAKISKLAIPSILQQSFVSVGNLFIQGIVNSFGSTVIAGYASAIKLNTFAITLFTTLSNSVSSYSAQNIGAGRYDRVKEGFRAGLKLIFAVTVPFVIVYFFFGEAAMKIFVKADSVDVINVGQMFLRIVSPFYLVVAVKIISDGVLHGGAAVKCFTLGTFTDLVLRVALAYIFPYVIGFEQGSEYIGIWLAWPVGWTVACILSFSFYLKGYWQRTNL